MRAAFDAREQILEVTLPSDPLYVEGDPTRLEQVFANLLSNAAKFSDAGSRIRLTAERSADAEAAIIAVADSGKGIAREDLARIFDLFEQVDSSTVRTTGGLGIGLTLARELVHTHRGTIEARSSGRYLGSEFVVRLPLIKEVQSLSAPQLPHGRALAAPPRRVLIVDDDADTANSLADVIALAGHEVRVALNGPAGIQAATEFEPHAVVLDLGMPGMDGFDVARRLRRMPGGGERLVIALSGYGHEDHRRQSREAGFDHHLTKPADILVLLELVAGGPGSAAPPATPRLGPAAPA